jgi:hypothetical protein
MSNNPRRKMQRGKMKSSQSKAKKSFDQALASMFAMEATFWMALNELSWFRRAWIGFKLTWGMMKPCINKSEESNA